MVVHIARQYQGRGLSLEDLLQEGSMGLMKSIEKFKPQVGCRFATYAYWWIRTMCMAFFKRLKKQRDVAFNKVFITLQKKKLHAGITVEKLEKSLFAARMPLSMQQSVWSDQDTTFQEVTADMAIEARHLSVEKQFMRIHMRNLLCVLNPMERKTIRLRFGIGEGKQKSLSEIGAVFGLSKERVRQLETRALFKLKQCLNTRGLNAYSDLLL